MTLTDDFKTNPLQFLKNHPLNPGDLGPSGDVSPLSLIAGESITKRYWPKQAERYSPEGRDTGVYAQSFSAVTKRYRIEAGSGGSADLKRTNETDDTMDAYYLPWKAQRVNAMTIPRGGNGNYFFTASLSGCSVFVRGNADNPTVYHAGHQEKAVYESTSLWERCMRALGQGHPTPNFYGIDKFDYRMPSPYAHKPGLKSSEETLQDLFAENDARQDETMTITQSSGCVIGARDGNGRWDFYLQERILYKVVHQHRQTATTYWTPVSVRRFFPTGAKNVQLLPRIQFQ